MAIVAEAGGGDEMGLDVDMDMLAVIAVDSIVVIVVIDHRGAGLCVAVCMHEGECEWRVSQ